MPDANRPPAALAAKLARAFQALAADLTLVSESDYPPHNLTMPSVQG